MNNNDMILYLDVIEDNVQYLCRELPSYLERALDWKSLRHDNGFVTRFAWKQIQKQIERDQTENKKEQSFKEFKMRLAKNPEQLSTEDLELYLRHCDSILRVGMGLMRTCYSVERPVHACKDFLRCGGVVSFPTVSASYCEALFSYAEEFLSHVLFPVIRKISDNAPELRPPQIFNIPEDVRDTLRQEYMNPWMEKGSKILKDVLQDLSSDVDRRDAMASGFGAWSNSIVDTPWIPHVTQYFRTMQACCEEEISKTRSQLRLGRDCTFNRVQPDVSLFLKKRDDGVGDPKSQDQSNTGDGGTIVMDKPKKAKRNLPRKRETQLIVEHLKRNRHKFPSTIACVRDFCERNATAKTPENMRREVARFEWYWGAQMHRDTVVTNAPQMRDNPTK